MWEKFFYFYLYIYFLKFWDKTLLNCVGEFELGTFLAAPSLVLELQACEILTYTKHKWTLVILCSGLQRRHKMSNIVWYNLCKIHTIVQLQEMEGTKKIIKVCGEVDDEHFLELSDVDWCLHNNVNIFNTSELHS